LEALYAASNEVDNVPQTESQSNNVPSKSADGAGDKPNDGVWLAQREVHDAGFLEAESVMPADVTAQDSQSAPTNAVDPVVLTAIPIGSWVEMMLEGHWTRMQLKWTSPHRTLFMFVAHGGKAHSMSQRSMDKLRVQGMIRVVSDGQLVEKALDAVAQTALRNSVDASQNSA
jgi:hypothetical protein